MTQQHPITPPPELVEQWRAAASNVPATLSTDPGGRRDYIDFIATRAAQWGADQELEACLRLVEIDAGEDAYDFARYIRAARRPKPPSLKEQCLKHLEVMERDGHYLPEILQDLRRALEALRDD